MLQSYGIHDYLLPNGVGGFFTGLSVTSEAIEWQPDLLYLIDEPNKDICSGVATCMRDQYLIVNSTITNEPRVFVTTADGETDLARWSKEWEQFAKAYITNKLFDYVVLLGLEHRVVIVIEMRRKLESRALRFHADSPTEEGVTWFELRTDMISMLRRGFSQPEPDTLDFRFQFVPYEPSSSAEPDAG